MSEELPSINEFIENRDNLPSVETFKEEVLPVIKKDEVVKEEVVPQVKEEHPDTSHLVNLIESVRNSIPQVKTYDKELYEIVKLIEQFKADIEEQRRLGEFEDIRRDKILHEQQRILSQELTEVKGSIPFVPEVKYYDDEINEIREDILSLRFDDNRIHKLKNRLIILLKNIKK